MSCFDSAINMDLICLCSLTGMCISFLTISTCCFTRFLDDRREAKIIGIGISFYVVTTTIILVEMLYLNSLILNDCGFQNYFDTACSNICPNNSKSADEITTYTQEASYCLKQCFSSNIKLKLDVVGQLRYFIFNQFMDLFTLFLVAYVFVAATSIKLEIPIV